MTSGFSFGSYMPGGSPIHKLDPRIKLTLGCAFIAALLLAQTPAALAIAAIFVFAAYLLARVPLNKAARSLAPLLGIVLVVAILNLFTTQGGAIYIDWGLLKVSEAGLQSAAFMGARLTIMMLGMSLITLTTPTLTLTEGFEAILQPFARFGLPAHELGMIMGIALRFMPQFATEFGHIYHAQVARGAQLSSSPTRGVRMLSSVTVPLFTSVFRHADTLAFAMDARCYHGGAGRTHLAPLKLAVRDAVACAALALLIAAVLALSNF